MRALEDSTDQERGLGPACATGHECPTWLRSGSNAQAHDEQGRCPACHLYAGYDAVCELTRSAYGTEAEAVVEAFLAAAERGVPDAAWRLEQAWVTRDAARRLRESQEKVAAELSKVVAI
jgi:hypothetical protein